MGSGQEVLPETDLIREWLLIDGAGAFACGTSAGRPTRREHAWLHAPDSEGRLTTLLLGMDEQLRVGSDVFSLTPFSGSDPGVLPAEQLEFSDDPWPRWRLRCGDVVLERSLFMVRGQPVVAVTYAHVSGAAARLRLGPLVVARSPEGLQRETPEMQGLAHGIPGRVRVETTPGGPALTFWHNGTFLP